MDDQFELAPVPIADPCRELAPLIPASERAPLKVRAALVVAVTGPFFGLVVAIVLFWGWGIRWSDLALLIAMYVLTAIGITVGFHRLFTHRSFETNRIVQFVFAILGSMAVQGPMLEWVALHRRHHQYSDDEADPHSPHHQGSGLWGVIKGMWHAHLGWMFAPKPAGLHSYVKDLNQNKLLRATSRLFPLWVLVSLLIPATIGWLITGTPGGAWTGFIWGGLVRIFLVHHVTWSINSVCHIWGRQPYRSEDQSRDNALFGILGMGEGWHNTHHAFPTSARHGLRWWQIDVSYVVIRCLELVGLAWNVKLPSQAAMTRASRSLSE
jgi:stearoyl-CoA desaturase (Delta-9 desaturase)